MTFRKAGFWLVIALCCCLLVGCAKAGPSAEAPAPPPPTGTAKPPEPKATEPPPQPDPQPKPQPSSWVKVTPPQDTPLYDVTWTGNAFIAVGKDAIISSPDGLNWTVVHQWETPGGFGYIAQVPGGQMATAPSSDLKGQVLFSTNGQDWELKPMAPAGQLSPRAVSSHMYGPIAYNGQRALIVSADTQQMNLFAISEDGHDWTAVFMQNEAQYAYTRLKSVSVQGVEVVAGEFYLLCASGTILVANGAEPEEIAYVGQRRPGYLVREILLDTDHTIVALGAGKRADGSEVGPFVVATRHPRAMDYKMLWSDNATDWHEADYSAVPGSKGVTSIHWTGSRFLASSPTGVLATSTDGRVWHQEDGMPDNGGWVTAIAQSGDGVIVAVTSKNAIYTFVP